MKQNFTELNLLGDVQNSQNVNCDELICEVLNCNRITADIIFCEQNNTSLNRTTIVTNSGINFGTITNIGSGTAIAAGIVNGNIVLCDVETNSDDIINDNVNELKQKINDLEKEVKKQKTEIQYYKDRYYEVLQELNENTDKK